MAEQRTSKKSKSKKVDEAVLGALRSAVLEHIGDTPEAKSALKTFEKEKKLSVTLQKIGEKLAKQKLGRKKEKAKEVRLTKRDIENLKKAVQPKNSTVTKKSPTPKTRGQKGTTSRNIKVSTAENTTSLPATEHSHEEKVFSPIIQKKSFPFRQVGKAARPIIDPRHLLRKPTFIERLPRIFRFKTLFIIFLILATLIGGGIGGGVYASYKTDANGPVIQKFTRILNLPAMSINDKKISLAEYKNDTASLKQFFSSEAEQQGTTIPTDEDIKQNVINRYITVQLIREALTELDQNVTDEDVNTQLEAVVSVYENEEELERIVQELYGWTLVDFIEKAFRPLLEEERLAVALGTSETLNTIKRDTIQDIKNQLDDGAEFATLARDLSEDVTADNGGDLDWFSKGDLVPEFENVAYALEIGEVSEPFQTAFGWHIVMVTDKNDEEETVRASHILIRNLTVEEFIEQKRNVADIVYYINAPSS